MENHHKRLSSLYRSLIESNYVSYSGVKDLKKVMGVYIIYSENNEILYIGSTNNFNVRFGVDLKHESTHTLVKKLIKAAVHKDRATAARFFTTRYKYKIQICESKREAEALEHFAIWALNPKYNNHFIFLDPDI